MSPALTARVLANRWVEEIYANGNRIYGAEDTSETVEKTTLPTGWVESLVSPTSEGLTPA